VKGDVRHRQASSLVLRYGGFEVIDLGVMRRRKILDARAWLPISSPGFLPFTPISGRIIRTEMGDRASACRRRHRPPRVLRGRPTVAADGRF
jgi:hypothetical protein